MIDLSPDRDWGPDPVELTAIARRSGCVVELGRLLHDGSMAYELRCPTHRAKLQLLANLAEYDSRHPDIMRLGERLAALGDGQPAEIARVVHAFVRDGVRHVPEPREKFQPTGRTLELGVADCDDTARAVVALLRAAGLRAGMLPLGNPPTHVAAGVQLGGAWRWLDASISGAQPFEHPIAAARRLRLGVRPELAGLGQAEEPSALDAINVPNLVTVAGFSMGVAWALGARDGWGIASIVLDELDGWIARALDQQSSLGELLDWGTDLVLTPLAWRRAGLPDRVIPALTAGQIAARHAGVAPRFGSVRAGVMLYDMVRRRMKRGRKRGRK